MPWELLADAATADTQDLVAAAKAAVITSVFSGVVLVIGAVGTLYKLFRGEKRVDAATAAKQDQTLAGAWRKAHQDTVERFGREQSIWVAERERLQKQVDVLVKENIQCRQETAELKAGNNIRDGKIAALEEQVQDLKGRLGDGTGEHRPAGEGG